MHRLRVAGRQGRHRPAGHGVDARRDAGQDLPYAGLWGVRACGNPENLFDCRTFEHLDDLSTNLYDGRRLATQTYPFVGGHTSYYSVGSLSRLAEANGVLIDVRTPLVATGYAGPRKRYILLSTSAAVMAAAARYFETHEYAPSESPAADREAAKVPSIEPAATTSGADAVRPGA